MSDKNIRRAIMEASEYEKRMDRLDQSPSKPTKLDPDTDTTKLFATLMGRPSIEQREQGRKPNVQHSLRLSEPMDEYVSAAISARG